MKVAFRVDSSSTIGSGHLMRCLTIAHALKKNGFDIQFWCTDLCGNFNQIVRDNNFSLQEIPIADQLSAEACLSFTAPDLLIVDHYQLAFPFENSLRKTAKKVMVIDDLANRKHDCDILLDQNLLPNCENRYDSLVSNSCIKLLGPRYLLLREEFHTARKAGIKARSELKNLFIFFGGSDEANLTSKAIAGMLEAEELGLFADIVIGRNHPDINNLQQLCLENKCLRLHIQTDKIAQLMSRADLAIGAGGSANWERCILGLPALLTTVAENQVDTTKYLEELGGCIYLGSADQLTPHLITEKLRHIAQNRGILTEMSKRSSALIVADGISLVVDAIKELLNR